MELLISVEEYLSETGIVYLQPLNGTGSWSLTSSVTSCAPNTLVVPVQALVCIHFIMLTICLF